MVWIAAFNDDKDGLPAPHEAEARVDIFERLASPSNLTESLAPSACHSQEVLRRLQMSPIREVFLGAVYSTVTLTLALAEMFELAESVPVSE